MGGKRGLPVNTSSWGVEEGCSVIGSISYVIGGAVGVRGGVGGGRSVRVLEDGKESMDGTVLRLLRCVACNGSGGRSSGSRGRWSIWVVGNGSWGRSSGLGSCASIDLPCQHGSPSFARTLRRALARIDSVGGATFAFFLSRTLVLGLVFGV